MYHDWLAEGVGDFLGYAVGSDLREGQGPCERGCKVRLVGLMVFLLRLCDLPSSFWTMFSETVVQTGRFGGFLLPSPTEWFNALPKQMRCHYINPTLQHKKEKKLEKGAFWKHMSLLNPKKKEVRYDNGIS